MPPGDWAAGERGLAALAGRDDEFAQAVERALVYAEATGVKRLHMMSGLADRGDKACAALYEKNLLKACDALAAKGLDLVIEPINGRNMPGYFLNSVDWAHELIQRLNRPNLKLQFDIYHCQIIHGDVTMRLRAMMPEIGHIQIASTPLRQEPGSGELDDARVLQAIQALGYAGHVGCEYKPAAGTIEGLGWINRLTA